MFFKINYYNPKSHAVVQILGKDVRENCVLINNVNRTDWSTVAGTKVILLMSKCAPVRFEGTGIISHQNCMTRCSIPGRFIISMF